MRLTALLVALAALSAAQPARPATADRERVDLLAADLARSADALATLPQVAGIGLVVVHDGRTVLAHGSGVRDIGSGDAVDGGTVFRVASLSKGFAAAVAGLLVREGALRWDMLVQPWLPGFQLANPDDSQRVTLRDILSHRVGLPYNTLDRRLEADEPYPLLVQALQDIPLRCPVGDCYGYQNIAFSLVGDMVFATTGEFYSFQVEKRLFAPLGMDTATYGREGLEGSGNWARPHIRVQNRLQPVTAKETYYRVAPAAGVNASPRDLGQWLLAQMGGFPDALPRELLDELHAPIVETPGEIRGTGWRRQRLNAAAYGLGWRIMDYAGERLVFHAGAVQGYRAMLGFLPDHGFGFAVVWNSEAGQPAGLLPVALDRFLGLPEVDWLELNRLNVRLPPSAQATASGSD
ncbi:MAG: serine hydrolase domain-containing protein [Pseudoxanthomonas sp.]|nr:serine hydrolase domain-containing protein [Pseudoxanthomonas sp.]